MYRRYFCTKCHTFIKDYAYDAIKQYDPECIVGCPIEGCSGSLVELDEFISETIYNFNVKGYPTAFSCSGHVNDPLGLYIAFEGKVNFDKAFAIEKTNSTVRKFKEYFFIEESKDIFGQERSVIRVRRENVDLDMDFKRRMNLVSKLNEILWDFSTVVDNVDG